MYETSDSCRDKHSVTTVMKLLIKIREFAALGSDFGKVRMGACVRDGLMFMPLRVVSPRPHLVS